MKTLIVYKSIHLGSTQKIAETIAKTVKADLKELNEIDPSKIAKYDQIGFGSGIYDGKFHQSILELIDKLPNLKGKRVFVFSTAGVICEKSHSIVKQKLKEKNAVILDEFYCKGFNKNSFLKYIGGMNKGRPNEEDFIRVKTFANNLKNITIN